MSKAISAASVDRNFWRVLRDVRRGLSYVVMVHGKSVAKIVPITDDNDKRAHARKLLMTRLQNQRVLDIGPWRRDELYDC